MSQAFVLAQISDSHLFAQRSGCHHQANVYENLTAVLLAIKNQPVIDAIVFTGDLTQDHSDASYQLFVQAFTESKINLPVYFLAGNHDEPELLERYLSKAPFRKEKLIERGQWQLLLLATKSATPAGVFAQSQVEFADSVINPNKFQLVLMHHHAVDAGYFIDRHGLENPLEFQQFLSAHPSIQAVACGHIHQGLTLPITLPKRSVNLYTCPATSIQFDRQADGVKNNGQPPGFRLFTLADCGQITTTVCYVEV
ncbi:Icc protein [Colwellia chukchiensis]|uniref:Icc protein n=1 Tax=Colwellia chukchiensis TaxID=641665 RepID=A0A1H7J0P6_9GAMM|nr:metallophosphoesterase [Colwellia chukchiensis]SEK67772.1 Icc protein [Colwellia chukchiensis]